MRITLKQSLSGPGGTYNPGETVFWEKAELVRLCAAGIAEPADDEARAAMQESVDEENTRVEAAARRTQGGKEKAVASAPEQAVKP